MILLVDLYFIFFTADRDYNLITTSFRARPLSTATAIFTLTADRIAQEGEETFELILEFSGSPIPGAFVQNTATIVIRDIDG